MSSTLVPDDGFRPLPQRPNLEFEKKRAKKLVKERDGTIKLAEAQLLVAREYGFSSWRKLAMYYSTWQMHERAGTEGTPQSQISLERSVKQLLAEFAARHALDPQPLDAMGNGAALAAYVPRFYGLSDVEIFASTLSEAEAQLVVARRSRFADWKAAVEFAASIPDPRQQQSQRNSQAMIAAQQAVRESKLDELEHLLRENPEWVVSPEPGAPMRGIVWDIIRLAIRAPHEGTLALYQVLAKVGVNVQEYLNIALLGTVIPKMSCQEVQGLLDLGANPNWKPRNGFSVLEHAIIRYGNGDAVDLIAQRTVPKKAFWIAAGLGDVKTMLQFVNQHGVSTNSARQDRPDAGILGTGGTVRPDASDLEVMWEAFMMAALNGRTNTMKALLDRGFPVNYTPVWYNALHVSVSYRLVPVVQFLLVNGADPDFKAWPDQQSPRDLSRTQQQHLSTDALGAASACADSCQRENIAMSIQSAEGLRPLPDRPQLEVEEQRVAVVKYMNGEAVDVIASRVAPRRAFWIAAGLDDVRTMLSFIDSDNQPTFEARRDRLDTNALSIVPIFFAHTPRPNAFDTDILWEAFMLAGLNGRFATMGALLEIGFPINYAPGPENMLVMSVRHQLAPVVEYLLSRGADPHYKSWPTHWSAVDMSNASREHYAAKAGVAEIHAMLMGAR